MVSILSNISSLRAQRQLSKTSEQLSSTFERLSSGLRINRPSDDAAGAALASALDLDNRIFTQAIRNVNDGISLVSIADQTLNALTDITERQKELAQQAANGSMSTAQRSALNSEAAALTSEYNRIIDSTKFNGIQLFQDDLNTIAIQAGRGTLSQLNINLGNELLAVQEASSTISLSAGVAEQSVITFTNNLQFEQVTLDFADCVASYSSGIVFTLDGGYDVGISRNLGGPTGAAIDFDVSDGDSGSLIAQNFATALGGSAAAGLYSATVNGSTVTLTSAVGGNLTNLTGDAFISVTNTIDGSGTANAEGTSFQFSNPDGSGGSVNYTVYFSTTGGYGSSNAIDVVLSDMGLSNQVYASEAATYLNFFNPSTSDITAVANGSSLTIVNNQKGAVTNISAGTFGTNASVSTAVQGVNGAVSVATDRFTYTAHGLATGDRILLSDSEGVPGGLSLGADYYAIVIDANTFSLASTYANALALNDIDITSSGSGIQSFIAYDASSAELSVHAEDIYLTSAGSAREALNILSDRQDRILLERGSIGSSQARLDTLLRVAQSTRENTRAAYDRIMNADMAEESAAMVRLSILQQAGAAVLAQANQQPAVLLRLLE